MNLTEPIIAKLHPDYLPKQKLIHTLMSLALTVYVLIISVWYDYSGHKLTAKIQTDFSWNTELMNVAGMVFLWLLFVCLVLNKLNKNYKGYIIKLDLSNIEKHTTGKAPTVIPYNKIAFAVQSVRKDYVLCDTNARAVLTIPYQIDCNDAVESLLKKEFAVVSGRGKFFGKASFTTPYIFLAFTFTMLISRSALAASIIGAIIILVVSARFYNYLSMLKTKNVKIKPAFFVALIIPIVIVLIVLIKKLSEF